VTAPITFDGRNSEAANAEYRRLQLMGVAPEVIAPLLDYVATLNAKQLHKGQTEFRHLLHEDGTLKEFFAVDPAATGAGKYVQVVSMRPKWMGRSDIPGPPVPDAVHSVVNKQTGEVSKSAGWKKGPAKSRSQARKGQPLVAFTLTDRPEVVAAWFARMDTYGSYLYSS
jgi:hypothetical protein